MKIYVQLGEAPIPVDERVSYRVGFRDFVVSQLQGDQARVLLVEPNPNLLPRLHDLWLSVANVEIISAHVAPNSMTATDIFFAGDAGNKYPEVFSQDEGYVRRYFPSCALEATEIHTHSLEQWLTEVAHGLPIEALSIDLRRSEIEKFVEIDWRKLQIKSLILTTDGVHSSQLTTLRKGLKTAGFHRAGRSWGEAKTSETFQKSRSSREWLQGAAAQARVTLGQVAVFTTQLLPNEEQRAAIVDRTRVIGSRAFTKADVLDATYGKTLQPVDIHDVEAAIENVSRASGRDVTVLVHTEPSIKEIAQRCFSDHGVWPISFSYPKEPMPINENPEQNLCSITPGFPYSFNDERAYLATYANARLGLTHRKAGWDCFRHLEIMASGAVPLMIDADQIPKYSMIHYPKNAFREVVHAIDTGMGIPDLASRVSMREFFNANLTSKAMASYILSMSGLADAKRVLFVDEQLPRNADYQSVLTLIGLKQLLSSNCEVAFPVDYVYRDSTIDSSTLYGRGFGYTNVLSTEDRSSIELTATQAPIFSGRDLSPYDALIVGSITRNSALGDLLLTKFPVEQTIWIYGEDGPPSIGEVKRLRDSGTAVFVRAISR